MRRKTTPTETTPIEKRKADITTWKASDDQIIAEPDGKIFVIHFDKVFPDKPQYKQYNMFSITKNSYDKQLGVISDYMNYFLAKYDKDQELIISYLRVKYYLDKLKKFNLENMDMLIDFIYDTIFTPTIVAEIDQLVEDNYLDDIEQTDGIKKYSTGNVKHLESLEFANKHIKIMLSISYSMKIMSPLMLHYFAINQIKLTKETDYIYKFYRRLFDLFSTPKDCNMYNKLFTYSKNKVLESYSNNEKIFRQREFLGKDNYSVIKLFVQKVLISENMVKFKFNETWKPKEKKYKENPIGFIKTIVKYQLLYFLREQYVKSLIEVTNTKNSDGLSGIDKMYMTQKKMDEGEVILMEEEVEDSLMRIRKGMDVPISEEEIKYYETNWAPDPLQRDLICNFFARYFGSYLPTNILSRRQFIIISLLLKKKLIIESGFEKDVDLFIDDVILPYVITGNKKGKTNTRVIRNGKFLKDCEESYLYERLTCDKYKHLEEIDKEFIMKMLSLYSNTMFTYCCYENLELLGVDIDSTKYKFIDELLFFLNRI